MSKLKSIAKTTAFAAVLGLSGWVAYDLTRPPYDGSSGITYGSAAAPLRGADVEFNVWYPALPGGKSVTVGGNGVFYGTPAGRDAPHQAGRFPMVVISHGAGGNAGQFGWIASELAQAGFVVVLPNHPGTTTGNASAEAAVRVWERPADLSPAAQDLRDPRIKAAVIVDPGIVETMTAESLAKVETPMLILNLGEEETIPTGVYARKAAELIPHATYSIVGDATHFSFLAQCKPKGAQILVNEGELDPLCDDAGGRARVDIHAELSNKIITYLQGHN